MGRIRFETVLKHIGEKMTSIDNLPYIMDPLRLAYEHDLPRITGSTWDYIHRTLEEKINAAGMNIQERDIGTVEMKLRSIFPDTPHYAVPYQAPEPTVPIPGAVEKKGAGVVTVFVLFVLYLLFFRR